MKIYLESVSELPSKNLVSIIFQNNYFTYHSFTTFRQFINNVNVCVNECEYTVKSSPQQV